MLVVRLADDLRTEYRILTSAIADLLSGEWLLDLYFLCFVFFVNTDIVMLIIRIEKATTSVGVDRYIYEYR